MVRMSRDDRCRESVRLCETLSAYPEIRAARSIGAFLPLDDEPDLTTFLRSRFNAGIRLALAAPRVDGSWAFRLMLAFSPLEKGMFGLSFPPLGDELPTRDLDVVLVPGRAFALDGIRLGRGGGIYDRLLDGYAGPRLGIAFSCQILDQLPLEPHDIRMTRIVLGDGFVPG